MLTEANLRRLTYELGGKIPQLVKCGAETATTLDFVDDGKAEISQIQDRLSNNFVFLAWSIKGFEECRYDGKHGPEYYRSSASHHRRIIEKAENLALQIWNFLQSNHSCPLSDFEEWQQKLVKRFRTRQRKNHRLLAPGDEQLLMDLPKQITQHLGQYPGIGAGERRNAGMPSKRSSQPVNRIQKRGQRAGPSPPLMGVWTGRLRSSRLRNPLS